MMQKRISNNLLLLTILTFLFFSSSGSSLAAPKQTRRTTTQLAKNAVRIIELHSIDQLQEAFQRDNGKVRLVAILSPT